MASIQIDPSHCGGGGIRYANLGKFYGVYLPLHTVCSNFPKGSQMFELGQSGRLPRWGGVGEMSIISHAVFRDDCDSGYEDNDAEHMG